MPKKPYSQRISDYVAWTSTSRPGVFIPKAHAHVCDGDYVAAAVLSQIIFWFAPSSKTGAPTKVSIQREGGYWLAKSRNEFADELGMSEKQVRRALDFLEKLGLLKTRVWRFSGAPTKHITVDWPTFFERLDTVEKSIFGGDSDWP